MTGREAPQTKPPGTKGFAAAEQIADAVLYEGYALYPYRANALKNRMRFQWGVLVPPGYAQQDPSERTRNRTQCLVEDAADGRLRVRVRFLHLQERTVQVEDEHGSWREVDYLQVGEGSVSHWDEAHDQHVDLDFSFRELLRQPTEQPFTLEGSESTTDLGPSSRGHARQTRRRRPLAGRVEIRAEPLDDRTIRMTVDVANETAGSNFADRSEALRASLVASHTMLALDTGRFVSLLSPPARAEGHVDRCASEGVYPVLIGSEDGTGRVMLSSPIILYDHPRIAPESQGDFFDATEIDELLALRTLTLTDDEKTQARSTDPRTAELLDRVDHLPPEFLERLHGTLRRGNEMPQPFRAGADPEEL